MIRLLMIVILSLCLVGSSYRSASNYYIEVDFSKPSTEKRFFIYKDNKLVCSTYVAHGINSGDILATHFSNRINSHESSLGYYRTLNGYYGHNGYSIKIWGISRTNSNAYIRKVVIHGANYIGNGKIGHSFGCFAIPTDIAKEWLPKIPSGTIIYAHI